MSVRLYLVLLALLAAERVLELWISRRNAAWSRARGGIEFGQRHFAAIKLLHGAFFPACAAEVIALGRTFDPKLGWPMLGLALVAQGLRYWAILSLGRAWNVRVIVVPGRAAVTRGPYRFVRHPNYAAVVLEMFAVPLVYGAWWTAAVFSVANAALLRVRIRSEEAALRVHCAYDERLGATARFVPRGIGSHGP